MPTPPLASLSPSDENSPFQLHTPALQSIHQLPRRLQAFSHQSCLLPDNREGILEEDLLIFHGFARISDRRESRTGVKFCPNTVVYQGR